MDVFVQVNNTIVLVGRHNGQYSGVHFTDKMHTTRTWWTKMSSPLSSLGKRDTHKESTVMQCVYSGLITMTFRHIYN